MTGFKIPEEFAEPSRYNLRMYDLVGYPSKGSVNEHIRYRELVPDLFQVQVWLEYLVKGKGILGRARSVMVSEYHVKRVQKEDTVRYEKVGDARIFFFETCTPRHTYKFRLDANDQVVTEYHVELDMMGRLIEYEDRTRGEDNTRIVEYKYNDGVRTLVRWRGRYQRKVLYYDGTKTIITRNKEGKPLLDNGDYAQRTYVDGILTEEEHYMAGLKHGFERCYNKFGRMIGEKYWHKGIEVPEWIYLDPKGVSAEEIEAEESDELRAVMIELQGTELFQVRMMARGMRAVRSRMSESSEVQQETIVVKRGSLVP
jgi:hypothetical protein